MELALSEKVGQQGLKPGCGKARQAVPFKELGFPQPLKPDSV
jgi:hypothetical protein